MSQPKKCCWNEKKNIVVTDENRKMKVDMVAIYKILVMFKNFFFSFEI